MSKATQQRTVNNYGQDTIGNSQNVSNTSRSSTSTRNGASESLRDLTSESVGASREIRRGNIAMQITFAVPIISRIPTSPGSSC